MKKLSLKHEINCSAEHFWKVFFDKEFNEKLYLQGLGFPEFKTLEQNETDQKITRRTQGRPKVDLPGPIAKVLGPNFGYIEEGSFDKSRKVWTWKMIPSTMAEKLKNEGTVRVEAVGDNKVRRVADLVVEAKIFGIGGLMESTAEKQLRDGWENSAHFMNKWLTK